MSVLSSVCSELSVCRMKCVLIWSFVNEYLFVCMYYVCVHASIALVCMLKSICIHLTPKIFSSISHQVSKTVALFVT